MNSEDISEKDVKLAKNLKIVMTIGLVVSSLILVSFVAKGLMRTPEKAGQPIEIANEETKPIEETKPVENPETTLAAQRQTKQLQTEASYNNLKQAFDNLDSELRLGRAQRWINQAKDSCDQMGFSRCSAPQEYLRVQLQKKLTELDSFTTKKSIKLMDGLEVIEVSQQMGTDSTVISQYRRLQGDILDISLALTLRPGLEATVVVVPTSELKATSTEFAKSISNLSETDQKTVTVTGKSEVANNEE